MAAPAAPFIWVSPKVKSSSTQRANTRNRQDMVTIKKSMAIKKAAVAEPLDERGGKNRHGPIQRLKVMMTAAK
ncbi:hypothetical protein RJP21_06070 [Paenibacillus sp. VCA1]|uniref:hypothetical protein n=1 Tax=Paenibacillus sp. VCA1 TaxID=3039148 RepID=UPI002872880C|nr:hypothetical protein [Paenibacillus sp. VCA1]MDR9853167.1 hypothetical protein [Paenibacillus sp. VCA1]